MMRNPFSRPKLHHLSLNGAHGMDPEDSASATMQWSDRVAAFVAE
jgi:hypothetical protein